MVRFLLLQLFNVDEEEKEPREVYKVEVPANRYDLLCLEGLVIALKSYLDKVPAPQFSIKNSSDTPEVVTVMPETQDVRPHCIAAILRNVTFNKSNYASFIELQDKLHMNICRKRTLVSMGTHDYDKIKGPITYEALEPTEIVFQALKQDKEMNAKELFDVLREDSKLKAFLPIIEDKPKYPVFFDANRNVLSLPPIINSDSTKVTLDTKNVFIEITATDL